MNSKRCSLESHWFSPQSRVCLLSLKKRLEPSLSCRFLNYAGNWRNLIGWSKRLKTKEHRLTENQNLGLEFFSFENACYKYQVCISCMYLLHSQWRINHNSKFHCAGCCVLIGKDDSKRILRLLIQPEWLDDSNRNKCKGANIKYILFLIKILTWNEEDLTKIFLSFCFITTYKCPYNHFRAKF